MKTDITGTTDTPGAPWYDEATHQWRDDPQPAPAKKSAPPAPASKE